MSAVQQIGPKQGGDDCLEVEEARVEASAKGKDLKCGHALRSEMGMEVLQNLPKGKDSREVPCRRGGTHLQGGRQHPARSQWRNLHRCRNRA